MRLTDILSESAIKVPLLGTSRETVIRELIDLIYGSSISPDARKRVYSSVMEREELMSTGIGQGIALPHGTGPENLGLKAGLGVASEPVDFDAIDGQPVELVFLLLAGEDQAGIKLKALARISRLLHREAFRKALSGSRSATHAMEIIVDEEEKHRI